MTKLHANLQKSLPPALEVVDVTRHFDGATGISGVNLIALPNQITSILGPSGSGKTTTLRVIAGFEFVDAGEVRLDGRLVSKPGFAESPRARNVGMVFQHFALFPHLTVAGNVAFGLRGQDRATRRRRVGEMLDLVGLTSLADRLPHELSGGEQQRVAVARALAPGPSVICLDEPFSDLDRTLRVELRREVRRLVDDTKLSAVFVTHDQEEALTISDSVVVMRSGRVVQTGSPESIYTDPVDPWVATFVGGGVLVPVEIEAGGVARSCFGEVRTRSLAIGCGKGLLLVRPESLKPVPPSVGGAAAIVRDVEFAGAHSVVIAEIEIEGHPVKLEVSYSGHEVPRTGERINLGVETAAPVIFRA